MVIEFAPKPQLPPAVEKSAVPKKPGKADHAEVAAKPKLAQRKAGNTDKETVEENGELF